MLLASSAVPGRGEKHMLDKSSRALILRRWSDLAASVISGSPNSGSARIMGPVLLVRATYLRKMFGESWQAPHVPGIVVSFKSSVQTPDARNLNQLRIE